MILLLVTAAVVTNNRFCFSFLCRLVASPWLINASLGVTQLQNNLKLQEDCPHENPEKSERSETTF